MNTLLLDHALLPDGIASDVEVTIKDESLSRVRPATESTAPRLEGLTLPGMATVTATHSTEPCAATPKPSAARFGHGETRCTPWRRS